MVGILLKFMPPERELQLLAPESGVCLEAPATRVRMSRGLAGSELLTEDAVPRRVQGALTYKFREVNGNPLERRGASSEQVSDAQVAS